MAFESSRASRYHRRANKPRKTHDTHTHSHIKIRKLVVVQFELTLLTNLKYI